MSPSASLQCNTAVEKDKLAGDRNSAWPSGVGRRGGEGHPSRRYVTRPRDTRAGKQQCALTEYGTRHGEPVTGHPALDILCSHHDCTISASAAVMADRRSRRTVRRETEGNYSILFYSILWREGRCFVAATMQQRLRLRCSL